MELYLDARVYDTGMVCVLEIMGRHAGWLTAASAIAAHYGQGPDLIYLPERNFDMDKFIADVQAVYKKNGKCIVAVSEGIHDASGKLIAEYGAENAPVDAFGHKQLGGLAANLANILKANTGAKVRGIEFSLLQRCAAHCASETDVQESFLSGKTAVERAVSGITDKMVGFERTADANGNYVCNIKLMDLADVANTEKKVPQEWINAEGNNVSAAYIDYALPLIQGQPNMVYENGLPRFAKLKKIKAQ
jgi:6-phosphofructokinase 1